MIRRVRVHVFPKEYKKKAGGCFVLAGKIRRTKRERERERKNERKKN
jgi:hypothetical protein